MRLGLYEREMVGIAVVVGIRGSSLNSIGLESGWCWAWEADNGFGRKERRVDRGWTVENVSIRPSK
jgi:hypothetical protein